MNNSMILVVVPLGQAGVVINSANQAGATGATILHARGVDNSSKVCFFKIEPEEEIIMIVAKQAVTHLICDAIRDHFAQNIKHRCSIYVLPTQ